MEWFCVDRKGHMSQWAVETNRWTCSSPSRLLKTNLCCRKRTAGAEARLVKELNGTTKVVPFPKPAWNGVFSAAYQIS